MFFSKIVSLKMIPFFISGSFKDTAKDNSLIILTACNKCDAYFLFNLNHESFNHCMLWINPL